MITLRIFLMGLVALVPTGDDNPVLTILMKRLAGHSAHVPVLIYEPNDRYCDDKDKDCSKMGDGLEIARRLGRSGHGSPGLLLNGEKIEILGLETTGKGPALSKARFSFWESVVGAMPSSPEEAKSDRWIPWMREFVGDSSVVSRRVWEGNKNITGRLEIADGCEAGCLSTYSLADVEGRIQTMAFRNSESTGGTVGAERAVADVAVIELKIKGDSVTFHLSPFDGKATRDLVLKPQEGKEVVEVLLGNLSPLDRNAYRKDPADHFALYTRLSKEPRRPFEIPTPHLGLRSVDREKLEPKILPEVIQAVNPYVGPGRPAALKTRAGVGASGGQGGSNRPICTLAVMEAPQPDGTGLQAPNSAGPPITFGTAYKLAVSEILPRREVVAVEEPCGQLKTSDERRVLHILTDKGSVASIMRLALEKFGADRKEDLLFDFDVLAQPLDAEATPQRARANDKTQMDEWRPLRLGVSIGLRNSGSAPGSLGMPVVHTDGRGREVKGFLTAAHVLEGSGNEVCQPAPGDKRCRTPIGRKVVAQLDEIDAAFVGLNSNAQVEDRTIYSGEELSFAGVKPPTCGTRLTRYGRSTESLEQGQIYSTGDYDVQVDGDSFTVKGFKIVPLDPSNPGDIELSAPGDSGSVWFYTAGKENWAVGLHIAGESSPEPGDEAAVATSLTEVFRVLTLSTPKK